MSVILHHEIDRSMALLSKDWPMAAYIDSPRHTSATSYEEKGWEMQGKEKKRCNASKVT